MAHIYSIHLVSPLSLKRIPKHASTHYTLTIYPTKDIAPKPSKGFARKPGVQRKTIKNVSPFAVEKPLAKPVAKSVTKPIAKAKKQCGKFRKNINKHALAAYFDNDVKLSRAAAIKKWQDAVVAELEAADKIAAQNTFNLQADIEHRYNALGMNNISYANVTPVQFSHQQLGNIKIIIMSQADFKKLENDVNFATPRANNIILQELTSEYGIYDEYDINPKDDLYFGEFDDSDFINNQNNNMVMDKEDDFYLFAEENQYPYSKSLSLDLNNQINESIVNRFISKYNGADTNAAMRAFEKQKFHGTGLPYILHKLQITK